MATAGAVLSGVLISVSGSATGTSRIRSEAERGLLLGSPPAVRTREPAASSRRGLES